MNISKDLLFGILFIILIPTLLFTQRTKEFQGQTLIDNETYHVRYNYYTSGSDTLLQGKYEADKPIMIEEGQPYFHFTKVKGNFSRNKPQGEWHFRNGQLLPESGAIFIDYNQTIPLSGNEDLVFGSFDNGKKTGEWQIFNWNISRSEVSDTVFQADLNFKNDRLEGNLLISSGKKRLLGAVSDKEMASGVWRFFTQHSFFQRSVQREWVFENDELMEIISYTDDETIKTQVSQDSYIKAEPKIVLLAPDYFDILKLIIEVNNDHRAEDLPHGGIGDSVILSVVNKISAFDTIMADLAGTPLSPNIRTTISVFPLDKEEIADLEVSRENLQLIDSLISNVLNSNQVSQVRVAVPEVEKYSLILQAIRDQLLSPFAKIYDLYDSGNLIYLDRNAVVNKYIDFKLEVHLNSANPLVKRLPQYVFHNRLIANQPRALTRMKNMTGIILEELDIVKDSINSHLEKVKKDNQMLEVQTSLLTRYKNLKHLTDSLLNEEVDELAGFQVDVAIITFLDRKITEYSELTDELAKSQNVDLLMHCMQEVETLVNTLRLVPKHHESLQNSYFRQVFNPYTFTNMEENIKPPLWKAYDEILLSSIFNNLKRLECINVSEANRNFDVLYSDMNNLLRINTRKAERKVKKTADPVKVAEILNLNLIFN